MLEKLVYVNALGKNSNNEYVYEFYFSDDDEYFWILDADVKPASLCNLGVPDKSVYNFVKLLKTNIKFDLAKKSSCFSFLDCKDNVIALLWENIDDYTEYPDSGRLIIPYGLDIDEVEKMLAIRNIYLSDSE